jgi:hypothetical protein
VPDEPGFFSTEAGQARTRALNDLFAGLDEPLDYYLGPTGIPDRIRALGAGLEFLNPITPITDAMRDAGVAADPDRERAERLAALARSAGTVASFGLPALIFGRMATPAVRAVPETLGLPVPANVAESAFDELSALLGRGAPGDWDGTGDPWEGVAPPQPPEFMDDGPDIDDVLPPPPVTTREDLIGLFGGEGGLQSAMTSFDGSRPADPDEAARNLMDFPFGYLATFNTEDGWDLSDVNFGDLLNAPPETVEALFNSRDFNFRVDPINPDMTREQVLQFFRNTNFSDAENATGLPFTMAEGQSTDWLTPILMPSSRSADPGLVLETPEFDLETSLFSPLTRAVQSLEQPSYGSVDEVRQNLIRLGARGPELQLAEDQGFFDALRDTEDMLGEIPISTVEEALGNFSPLSRTEQGGTRSTLVTSFDTLFTPGGENYRETIFTLPQTPAGRTQPFVARVHWPNLQNPAFHMRSATFPTEDGAGRAFHVGEIQSDMGAEYRRQSGLADWFTRPLDRSPLQWQLDLQGRARGIGEELLQLIAAINADDPSLVGETDLTRVGERLETLQRRFEAMPPAMMDPADSNDLLSPETIRSIREGVDLANAPMVRNSTSINQAAVARSLDDAVREGSDWLTFSTGDMTYGYTRGTREGQRTAYDTILPRDINSYLRRLNEHIREQVPDFPGLTLEETTISAADGAYRVPGIRLTPEIRQVISESGIPAFREGGIVSLLN